jgi:hypothetical protein
MMTMSFLPFRQMAWRFWAYGTLAVGAFEVRL